MSSKPEFVTYIADQLQEAGEISYRKMFGEYGVYCNGIFFAVICNNQLFIKMTEAGTLAFPNLLTAPPYDGAKDYFLIEDTENKKQLTELTQITCGALPTPKKRPKKQKNSHPSKQK